MRIKKLALMNYRNYSEVSVLFSDNINVFYGDNATGKTNIVESLYLLSYTKSFRTKSNIALIQKEKESAIIEAEVSDGNDEFIKGVLTLDDRIFFRNRNLVKRYSSYIGALKVVLFQPNDVYFFHNTPSYRRREVDVELSKIFVDYMQQFINFNSVLKSRNKAIKNNYLDYMYIETLTEKMNQSQLKCISRKNEFISFINTKITTIYQNISRDSSNIEVKLISNVNHITDENDLNEIYKTNLDTDINLKHTNIGLHKDDVLFLIDNRSVCDYASQGQKRQIILSYKLALVEAIKEFTHQSPILLLDDVLSELDDEHRNLFLNQIPKDIQILITTCDQEVIQKNSKCKIFKVQNNRVEEMEKN